MKKIITALINKNVNEKLREYKELNIIMNDIQYQDGIFEAMEIEPNIDYIILSELLPGKYEIKELVQKIKEIKKELKIIIILEKENDELENYLISKGNIKIFYNNSVEIREIAQLIINKKEDIEKQIKELKEIVFNKEENNIKENKTSKIEEKNNYILNEEEKIKIEKEIELEYKSNLIINKIINKIKKLKKEKINSKIILVTGASGTGKSVFTVNLAKRIEKENKEVLIIDFDTENNSISTLLGIKEKIKNNMENENYINYQNIEKNKKGASGQNYIININSKIKLISYTKLLSNNKLFYNNSDEINCEEIIKLINNVNCDFIIIDIGNKNYKDLNLILKKCDKIICLTELNILQIKKTKNILLKYIEKYELEKEKIYIVFNKIQKYSFGINIYKEIFKEYKILGKIDIIKNCDLLINNKMKQIFLNHKIKEQYKKIMRKINRNINIEKYYLNKNKELL